MKIDYKTLSEMVKKTFDEQILKEAPNPEDIKQIQDWGRKNNLDVEEKTPGILIIKVPPIEINGKSKDDRDRVVLQLSKELGPLGYVRDFSRKGRFVKKPNPEEKGKYTQLSIIVKSTVATGGAAAAAAGMGAEKKLADSIALKLKKRGITATTAGFGHGSDLTIQGKRDVLTIEVKTSLGADFGQFKVGYDLKEKTWKAKYTAGFQKHESLFGEIFLSIVKPYLNKNAKFTKNIINHPILNISKDGRYVVGLNSSEQTGQFKSQIQSLWFNDKTDVSLDFDFQKLANYYASKGDKYLQIMGKGLYGLTVKDSTSLGVPYFADSGLKGTIRIRIKPAHGPLSAHSFVVAIKMKGTLSKSSLDLTNPADLDKLANMIE